jgi:hypothetical protein
MWKANPTKKRRKKTDRLPVQPPGIQYKGVGGGACGRPCTGTQGKEEVTITHHVEGNSSLLI